MARWDDVIDRLFNPEGEVTIGVVGKYVGLQDAYKSLTEALVHGGLANRVKVHIQWLDAELFEHPEARDRRRARADARHPRPRRLRRARQRGQDRLASISPASARVPFFGICLGMQMACIEAARNTAGIEAASSTEFGECRRAGRRPDHRMDERGRPAEARGRTATSAARCGSAPMRRGSTATASSARSTAPTTISERHRHRYEVNIHYKRRARAGRPGLLRHEPGRRAARDRRAARPSLVHRRPVPSRAEVRSRSIRIPLFASFIEAAVKQSRLV